MIQRQWMVVAGGLLLAGCAAADDEPATEVEVEAEAEVASPGGAEQTPVAVGERPATRQAEVLLEGTPEALSVRLFRTPEGFPLPFSTYVPEDMVAEPASSDRGDAVHFVAAFGGQRNDEALLALTVLPAGTTREQALEAARHTAGRPQATPEPDPRFPWAAASYLLEGSRAGYVAAGEHAGRWFYFREQYPREFGDGFVPRTELIRSEWRWKDTGAGLGG